MAKKLSGEAALLSWAQGAASSHGLTVKNLAAAWADGLAFAALAHRYFPDKINFSGLKAETREDKLENHRLAYKIFEEAGVYPLLDPEDLVDYPADKKSVVTYLSEVYKGLKGLPAIGAGTNTSAAGASDLDAFAAQLIANHKASKAKATAVTQPPGKATAASRREPQQSSAPPCTACGEQLSGQTAQIGSSEFHLNCFKCQGCGKKLNATQGASLLAVGNLPYCESCGRQAFIKARAGGAAKKAPAAGRGDMFERRKQQMQALEAAEPDGANTSQRSRELELAEARKAAEEEARLKRQLQEEDIRKKREEEAAKEKMKEEERKARELAAEDARRQRERERAQEEAAQKARDAVAQLERTSSRTETFLERTSSRRLAVDSVADVVDDAEARAQRRRAEAEARRKQLEEEMSQLEQERLRRQAEREARRKAEAEREEQEERERNERRERERNERKLRLLQEQEQLEREAEERRRQRHSTSSTPAAQAPELSREPSRESFLSTPATSSRSLITTSTVDADTSNHEEDPIARRRREREERRKAEEAAAAEAERQREEERFRRRKEREEARKREEEELERQRQERLASRESRRPIAIADYVPPLSSHNNIFASTSMAPLSTNSLGTTTAPEIDDLEARRIAREKERELRRKQLEEEEQELERRRQQRAAEREARRKKLEEEEAEFERQRQQRAAEREARRKELL